MRSDIMKKGYERAPHRSLMMATGIKAEVFKNEPFGKSSAIRCGAAAAETASATVAKIP